MTKHEREIVRLFASAGAKKVEPLPRTGADRICMRVYAANGQARKFFTSSTPSDHRARRNILSTVRQFCRLNEK